MDKRSISLTRELLHGPRTGAELSQALGLSQPTFSRLFQAAAKTENIRGFGTGKSTLYASPRKTSGVGPTFPLFQVDEAGVVHSVGDLTAIENRGFILEPLSGPPVIFPGIPFFLSDARPQGYLGRAFCHRHANLGFPKRIQDWSEDQIFTSLALRGEHLPGNFIVGGESFNRYQNEPLTPGIALRMRAAEYEALSEKSLSGDLPGSSAAGEQPKFSAYLADGRHVLVKFSPLLETPRGRRWADLLVAESIALETLREEFDIHVSETEIILGENRVFLESTRFDRVGARGRRGCLSFASLEAEWLRSPSVWAASAKSLLQKKRITQGDSKTIQVLDAFGAWIANSDRHYGNLSFFYEPAKNQVQLSPVYDMLPMFFAPKEGEESEFSREWSLPRPHPDTLSVWDQARAAAVIFWKKVATDARISPEFRKTAATIRALL